MIVRPFADADLAAVHAIQSKCPQAAQWRPEGYLHLAGEPGGLILVAEIEAGGPPEVAGFAAFHRVLDEAELRNLAVAPAHQRQGIARALLEEGIRTLQRAGARRIFLEVRPSNYPALAFYASAGFKFLCARGSYYQDPAEDALVMACDMTLSSQLSTDVLD
jgi:ribosomal-protein-alanine N-acetyltransferase